MPVKASTSGEATESASGTVGLIFSDGVEGLLLLAKETQEFKGSMSSLFPISFFFSLLVSGGCFQGSLSLLRAPDGRRGPKVQVIIGS